MFRRSEPRKILLARDVEKPPCFSAVLARSHVSKQFCNFKFSITPKIDRVMAIFVFLKSGELISSYELFRHLVNY